MVGGRGGRETRTGVGVGVGLGVDGSSLRNFATIRHQITGSVETRRQGRLGTVPVPHWVTSV